MADLRADLLALLRDREDRGYSYVRMADVRAVLDRAEAAPEPVPHVWRGVVGFQDKTCARCGQFDTATWLRPCEPPWSAEIPEEVTP